MMKLVLFALLAAVAAAPVAARADEPPVQAPALVQDDVRAALQARYATIKAALESGDAAPLYTLVAPGFTITSGEGGALPSSVLIAALAQFGAIPGLHITFEPDLISPTDEGVVVRQHYGVEIPEVDAAGARHEADIDAASTDTWVNLGDRWVLKSMQFTHWTGRYDGRAVKDLCFGCYPSAG